MRKENSVFKTSFLSEEGSELLNRDYFAYVELDKFACYVAADSLDEEREINSAEIVVRCIIREFTEHPSMSKLSIRRNITKAHKELLANKDGFRLRASVSLVVTNYVKMRFAAVGNSRFSLFRNGRILYTSKDQSLTENLVERELIPRDKAAIHEERNNLYAFLGQVGRRPQIPVSRKRKLINGDILTLYTRGVWENLTYAEFLNSAADISKPEELADNIEELILGKRKAEFENYTIAVTFVDKVYLNPKKRWTLKKVLMIVIPVALVLLILGIVLFVRYRIRRDRTEEMEQYLSNAVEYQELNNYEKASGEYEKALELAKSLKDEDQQDKLEGTLLLLEHILLADETLNNGEYQKAQELYNQSRQLSTDNGGIGLDYIDDQLDNVEDYLDIFELLDSGEIKEDYGDYAGAIELYKQAREKASALYYKDARQEALDKQRAAEESLDTIRRDELAALEKEIQDAIVEQQAAQELENQGLMNDKKNALELESKGNELMKNEDYLSAISYFETAKGMYETLEMPDRVEALDVIIASCLELNKEAEKKAAAEADKAAAEEANQAAEEAEKALEELKDAQRDKAVEDALKAAEEAKKAAEEAKEAAGS